MKLTLFILLLPIFAFGQITIRGKVINSNGKMGIPFATIGLINENIGTNASEEGFFQFTSNKKIKGDTIIVSCLGYKTLKLSYDFNNMTDLIVELTERVIILNDILVESKKNWTSVVLNNFSNCGNSFVTSNGFQTQLAQHFQVNEENSLLTDIKICRRSTAFLDPEKTVFRIRIYDIDTLTKAPSTALCNQIIEVKTRNKFINLNLEEYKIRIPTKDFFVSVEWVKIPYNESKSEMKVNGKKVQHITYRPSIGWTDNVNTKMEAWSLDYKNIWRPMITMTNKTSISISATVIY